MTRDGIGLDEAVYSPGEMRLVVDTPDLPTLQRHATDLGLERGLKARITRMQRSKAWGDLGRPEAGTDPQGRRIRQMGYSACESSEWATSKESRSAANKRLSQDNGQIDL